MNDSANHEAPVPPGKIWRWALAVALAGLLFGFDVAVISGAEKAIQSQWALSPAVHGLILSAAIWGTVAGAIGGAWPTDRWGRKGALIAVAIGYLVASLGSAFAAGPLAFAIFRFIGGLAIGVSSIAAPAYISEIAPPAQRGRLVGLYQFNIVGGILIAYESNWLIGASHGGADTWRWMLGVQALPSLAFLFAIVAIPESPMWSSDSTKRHAKAAWRSFLRVPLFKPACLAVAIAFFNQLSGINAVIYFAPRIFEEAGLGTNAALLASVGVGVINFVATGAGVLLLDRAGRRKLMVIGSVGYCVSLAGIALAFMTQSGGLVAPLVFLFVAAHAVGQGAVIWVFLAEIFPTDARARGQSIGSATHWLLAAIVTMVLPPALATFPPEAIFGFFLFMMLLQLVWVLTLMPETKDTRLDEGEVIVGH